LNRPVVSHFAVGFDSSAKAFCRMTLGVYRGNT
jgi:hypothetical protein